MDQTLKTRHLTEFHKSRTRAISKFQTDDLSFVVQWYPKINITETIKLRIKKVRDANYSLDKRMILEVNRTIRQERKNTSNDAMLEHNILDDNLRKKIEYLRKLSDELSIQETKLSEIADYNENYIKEQNKELSLIREKCVPIMPEVVKVPSIVLSNFNLHASLVMDDDLLVLDGNIMTAKDTVRIALCAAHFLRNAATREKGFSLLDKLCESTSTAYHRVIMNKISQLMHS